MKKQKQKLALDKLRIKILTDQDSGTVVGGAGPRTFSDTEPDCGGSFGCVTNTCGTAPVIKR